MYLTKDKLLSLWRNRAQIFADSHNAYVIERFNRIGSLFDSIVNISVEVDDENGSIFVDKEPVVFQDGRTPSMNYFGPGEDGNTAAGAFNGVKIMSDAMPKFKDLIENIGCLLGGFDFTEQYRMVEEFRIVSATILGEHDNGSTSTEQMSKKMSSNLADNNYFFNVITTIRDIANDCFDPNTSKFVLVYPHDSYYPGGWEEAESTQKQALIRRFPYKFFHMWTHRDSILHLIGLLPYKTLITNQDKDFYYDDDAYMNQPYNEFINGWQAYSNKVMEMIPEEERGESFVADLSKLISVLLANEQDIKSMEGLINSGNKALILWGPPGTGKTYQAHQLIRNLLHLPDGCDINQWMFDKKENVKNEGAWTLVQFHPNYTYEDFVGGISPNLTGNTLSYTLKEGIFKTFCDSAASIGDNRPFVFIIDEINRADLSAVFGELLYALEYRGRSISIPNFSEKFVIPENVYIIGTMNNVDKSLVTFDLALRRRFGFYKVMPNMDVLKTMLASCDIEENCLEQYIIKCKNLNQALISELNLNENYQIGHAYFGKIKSFLPAANGSLITITPFEMEQLWSYHIEPLLEEYLGGRTEDSETQEAFSKGKNDFIAPF